MLLLAKFVFVHQGLKSRFISGILSAVIDGCLRKRKPSGELEELDIRLNICFVGKVRFCILAFCTLISRSLFRFIKTFIRQMKI